MFHAFDRQQNQLARFACASARDLWIAARPGALAVPDDFTALAKARWETVGGVEVGTPTRANTPLTAEQQQLAEQWVPLAHKLTAAFCRANRIAADHLIRDELTGVAMEYLLKAVRTFNPELGLSPGTLIGVTVTRGLVRGLALAQGRGLTSGPGRVAGKRAPKVGRLADRFVADGHATCISAPEHWDDRTREQVLGVIEQETDERCAYLWDLYAFKGLTLRQVGKRVGLSTQGVLNALGGIRDKEILRERIESALEYV